MVSEWRELEPLGGVRRIAQPDGAVQYEAQPGETARDAKSRGTIAALVTLCEEMLYDLEMELPPHRAFDLAEYQARLAQLKGEG